MSSQTKNSCAKAFDNRPGNKKIKVKKKIRLGQIDPLLMPSRVIIYIHIYILFLLLVGCLELVFHSIMIFHVYYIDKQIIHLGIFSTKNLKLLHNY